ncbi:MAG: DUF554 family protein [Eubacteriales bacterium]
MLGTIVNVIAIVIGSLIGVVLKGGLKEKYKDSITIALGLAVVYVGASGAIGNLLDENANSLLFIISLAVGTLIGEWIDIEKRLGMLGDFIEKKMSNTTSNISLGFVTASLIKHLIGKISI